ncbi:MAG: GNAT family N-acetyltransferase [Euryarchaeota archaeon]|nr:GNAT family N-acetyltransferase [Euryarchaeota archaeon]
MLKLRSARIEDLDAITEIYNEAILKTVATFDTELKTYADQKKWFDDHGSKNPILVAEQDGVIVGWASLSKWSDRCAYSDTAEISLYIREKHQGRGIGRRMIEAIITEGKKAGLHTVIARITEGNESSLHLHRSVGFSSIGTMKEVGKKFGKRLDVHLMQKTYDNH